MRRSTTRTDQANGQTGGREEGKRSVTRSPRRQLFRAAGSARQPAPLERTPASSPG